MASTTAPSIVTPEAVVLDLEPAGVASRTLAITLDLLAIAAVWTAAFLLFGATFSDDGTGSALVYVVFSLLLVVAWFVGFEVALQGRTPGKMALGLRVVSVDGTPERFQQAFLRAAVGFVDFLLIPIGLVAVVVVLVSPREQRLGDLAAGTLVIRERMVNKLVAPAVFVPPWGFEQYASGLDVRALDAQVYGLIRSYLLRVPELSAVARDHLAVRLANPIAEQMGHRPPGSMHPHAFLTCVAAAWQRLHGTH